MQLKVFANKKLKKCVFLLLLREKVVLWARVQRTFVSRSLSILWKGYDPHI